MRSGLEKEGRALLSFGFEESGCVLSDLSDIVKMEAG